MENFLTMLLLLLPSLLAAIKFEVLRDSGTTAWKKPGFSVIMGRKVTLFPATSHLTDTLRNINVIVLIH